MEHSNAMEEYARKEIKRVEKFLQSEPEPIHFDLVLEAARQHHHHKVELRINTKHYHVIAHSEGADMYQQIDLTIDKATKEVKKAKEKALDERNHPREMKLKDDENN